MKIGFSQAPASAEATYLQHLAKVLARHAPEHEYRQTAEGVDLFHWLGGGAESRPNARTGRVKTVVTVTDATPLRFPGSYTLRERVTVVRRYRRTLERAEALIALSPSVSEALAVGLGVPPVRIACVPELAMPLPHGAATEEEAARVRRKYALPDDFVLTLGIVEPRHNQGVLVEALRLLDAAGMRFGAVICGRRTYYADRLLGYVRRAGLAGRVEFLYEPEARDLPALYGMARIFAYLPDARAEASAVPVVEALRSGLPTLLSDTPANRTTAADAARYADASDPEAVAEALSALMTDEAERERLRERSLRRAELYAERAVAQRLIDIYTSL